MAFGAVGNPVEFKTSVDDRNPTSTGKLPPRTEISNRSPTIQQRLLKVDFENDCMNKQILDASPPFDIKKKFKALVDSTTASIGVNGDVIKLAKKAKDKYNELKTAKRSKGETFSLKEVIMDSIKSGAKNLKDELKAFGKKELKKARNAADKYVDDQKNTLKGIRSELEDTAKLLTQNPVFVKVLPPNMVTHGYKWRQGLNIVPEFDSDPLTSCSENGLYFTDLLGLSTFLQPGLEVWQICVPNGSEWVKDPGIQRKWRANQVVLVRKYDAPDLSKLANLMNLPDIRIPDLTLPCPTIANNINDLANAINDGLEFDVAFNNEFFDYGLNAVALVNDFPDKADDWLDTDRIIGNIPLARELEELKGTSLKGIKGKALEKIKSIDPTQDIINNVKDQATACLNGVEAAVNNVVEESKELQVGISASVNNVMSVGTKVPVSELSKIKQFGF